MKNQLNIWQILEILAEQPPAGAPFEPLPIDYPRNKILEPPMLELIKGYLLLHRINISKVPPTNISAKSRFDRPNPAKI